MTPGEPQKIKLINPGYSSVLLQRNTVDPVGEMENRETAGMFLTHRNIFKNKKV
jgi:hypothetical protein